MHYIYIPVLFTINPYKRGVRFLGSAAVNYARAIGLLVMSQKADQ